MFMLMGAVYLHRLPELEAQLAIAPQLLDPTVRGAAPAVAPPPA